MGKLKRVRAPVPKSILHKGREVFRTHADATEANKVMSAYMPLAADYELVELMAANNISKVDAAEHFRIDEKTFDKHFEDHYARGKMRKNMKTTKTLFDLANGQEGLWDAKKKRWVVRPRSPDTTALIWWDKTRGGWREGTDVNVKSKGLAPSVRVVVYLPPNGREAGAAGDPRFVLRQAPQVIDATTVSKNSRNKQTAR